MPRHDYHCATCDTTEERQVLLKDLDAPQRCDTCGAKLERLFVPGGMTIIAPMEFTGSQLVGTIRADNQHGEPRRGEENRRWDRDCIQRSADKYRCL